MKRIALALLTLGIVALLARLVLVHPSNSRNWIAGQEVMPTASINGNTVAIHGLRNFSYAADGTPTRRYEDRTYDLDKLETVWFILAPFSRASRGLAHSFLSFGFADSQFVAISVEARREEGENYSLVKGMLHGFEIMYVVADERDLIGFRSNIRHYDVYVYPIHTTPAKARALFTQMLERANALHDKPEFYNTLTNNCTTNILRHANSISPHRIPYGKEVLLPGYADELAQRLGLLDTNLPLDQARQRYLVNERARKYAEDPLFSVKIRNAN
jgi:hypothetical protein